MGTKKAGSPLNVLTGWLNKKSMKVKTFLGALLAFGCLVALKFTVKQPKYFFVASESAHLAGMIVLIYKLFTRKTCSGLSLKTQELTAVFLAVRLGCSAWMEGDIHTVLDLISFMSTLLVIWMIRSKLKSSYIKEFDNMRLSFVVVPCAVLALLVHPSINFLVTRILWAFCVFLEAVSVLPQLRFMQNAKVVETFTGKYVFALGVSRFFSLAHWLIQTYETRGGYLFLAGNGTIWFAVAFLAEMVQSFILADFCYYYIKSFTQGQLLRKMPV